MSGLTLSLRSPLSARVDLTGLVTGEWQKATTVEMAGRAARSADGAATVGDLFHVDGTPGDTITLRGDLSLADGIGTALAGGSVRIEGDAGDRAGASMTGGRIEVEGNAGRSAGEGMAGGALVIGGNCGSRAGAAAPGRKRGMTGGEIIILGNAGDEAGASMRRGLIVVGGRTGAFPLLTGIAGTLVACGDVGDQPALWNKRGSLVCLGQVTPGPTYRYACSEQPVYLRMLLQRLRAIPGLPLSIARLEGTFRRYSGDFAESGKGEILAWSHG